MDSEHCAIHQCLRSGRPETELRRLVLTASGGPFRGRGRASLASVTVEEALAHPTWSMGPKITIDSSTLMNKGLEVLEAHELFDVGFDRIEVVVHPQSVVHSMVEWTDGATVAQLSMPDMRLPIGYALSWPSRLATPFGAIDWAGLGSLTFEPPDRDAFPCLELAYQAGRAGGLAPAWLNAANEVAVAAFLDRADPVAADRRRHRRHPAGLRSRRWDGARRRRCGVRRRPPGAGIGPGRRREDGGMTDVEAGEEAGGSEPADAPRGYLDRWREGLTGGYARPGEAPAAPPPEPTPEQQRRSVLVLVGVVVLILAVGAEGHFLKILAVIAVIAAVIMLHELGHFTAAKLSGMKVERVLPRLRAPVVVHPQGRDGVRDQGHPGRRLRPDPRDEQPRAGRPRDEPRTYRQASFPKRFAVAVAGSSVHFVLALVAVWTLFAFAHTAKATTTIDALVPAQRGHARPGRRPQARRPDRLLRRAPGVVVGTAHLHRDARRQTGHAWSSNATGRSSPCGRPRPMSPPSWTRPACPTARRTPASWGSPRPAPTTRCSARSRTPSRPSGTTGWSRGSRAWRRCSARTGCPTSATRSPRPPGNTSVQQAGVAPGLDRRHREHRRPGARLGFERSGSSSWSTPSSGPSTCSRCCPSTAATWPSPCTSGSVPAGGVRYRADANKMVPYALAVMALLLFVGAERHLPRRVPPASRCSTDGRRRTAPGVGWGAPSERGLRMLGPNLTAAPRRKTRQIRVGSVPVGGDAPISVQSMTITKTADVEGTLQQIYALAGAGADIVRCTCNRQEAAEGLARIVPRSPVPIIADIHNNHLMALAALDAGVHGLRLNPGNIRHPEHIKAVAREARDRGVPIRIGVNAGSLDDRRLYKVRRGDARGHGRVGPAWSWPTSRRSASRTSRSASRPRTCPLMIEAYRMLADVTDHPLHVGVTEAGPGVAGLIKGTAGIGTLLAEGIGDTIRYSLTADPVEEAKAGRQLLECLGLRTRKNVDLIACPSCGRAEIDVIAVANQAMAAFGEREIPLQVAVMGCVVNGPGEARRRRSRHRRRPPQGPPVHQGPERRRRRRGRDGRLRCSTTPERILAEGADAVLAGADLEGARRAAEDDRAALLDEKGADANASEVKVDLIRRHLGEQ